MPLNTHQVIRRYIAQGLRPIPVVGKKNDLPTGWPELRITEDEIEKHWPNSHKNVGLINDLWCAIDLDCPEALALAGRFLEPTRTSGHGECLEAHWWYRLRDGQWYKKFTDLDGTTALVEFRGDGGHFTLVSPSIHPDTRERYEWAQNGLEVAEAGFEELRHQTRALATAALVARHLPEHRRFGGGGRHDFALALAGLMLRDERLDPDTVRAILYAAWDANGWPTEKDRREAQRDLEGAVRDTSRKLAEEKTVKGGVKLNKMVSGLASKIADYWGWGEDKEVPDPAKIEAALVCTDTGNSRRFAAKFSGRVIHSNALGGFGVWDGKRFDRDEQGRAVEMAKTLSQDLLAEAGEALAAGDKDAAKRLSDWAITSCSAPRINAALGLARSEPGIAVHPDDLDAHPFLLNVENGTIDLKTGELRAHDPDDLVTKLAPVAYDPDATAPTWEAFLKRVLPSKALRRFVQKLVGYCLTGSQAEQVLPFFHGAGANGKSTLVNIILELLGDYAQQAAPDLLVLKPRQHPTELAELKGRRFVASVEVEDGRRLAESLVKQLTGGEKIRGRFMHRDFFEFWPEHHVLMVANHRPMVRGVDYAIWRRIKLVPFAVTIPKEEQDSTLPEKLRTELPGILNWAIEGCLAWQREGLGEPEEVTKATAEYREEQDTLGAFISECCYVHPDAKAKYKTLYAVFEAWCQESGEEKMKKREFGKRLDERGFVTVPGTGNVKYKQGIGISDDAPDPDNKGQVKINLGESRVTDESGNSRDEKQENAESGGGVTDAKVTQDPGVTGKVTPQNTSKTDDFGEAVTDSYQQSANSPHEGEDDEIYKNSVTVGNSVTPQGEKAPDEQRESPTPGADNGTASTTKNRRLTEEEARQVQKLISEGMSPAWARAEVIGEEENCIEWLG